MQVNKSHPIHMRNDESKKRKKVRKDDAVLGACAASARNPSCATLLQAVPPPPLDTFKPKAKGAADAGKDAGAAKKREHAAAGEAKAKEKAKVTSPVPHVAAKPSKCAAACLFCGVNV